MSKYLKPQRNNTSYSLRFSNTTDDSFYKSPQDINRLVIHNTGGQSPYNTSLYVSYNDTSDDAWLNHMIPINFEFLYSRKRSATEEEAERIAFMATEFAQDFIERTYDRYDIQEQGDWLYQRVTEEITEWIHEHIHEEYDFEEDGWDIMYDALMDVILKMVDYDAIYETFDSILHAPITMSEKLRDIGMSESDFL